PDLERRFHDLFAATPAALHNLYGPTEAAVDVTFWRCRTDGEGEPVPLGRPAANTVIRVLDRDLRAVPAGVAGELAIGGVQLARGYWRRPELTAERFVPDPDGEAGQRLYRTGDLARFRSDGILEYLGRIDHQVKLRGFRIELGEIEAALLAHPQVREAAVLLRDDPRLGPSLAAFVVPEPGASPEARELRDSLEALLPEHMVPASVTLLPALPLSANGKLDRGALARAEPGREEVAERYVAPRTPVEEVLSEIWADVLGLARVGIEDNFFALGGHSLLATQVTSRVYQALGVELPVRRLFEAPTVARLAAQLAPQIATGAVAPPIPRTPRSAGAELPLSFAQERLWFLDRLVPDGSVYNVPTRMRLRGRLDRGALARSFAALVARHESLRTTFATRRGHPVQVVGPPFVPDLPLVDLRGLAPGRREALAATLGAEEARRPFQLASGPLLRLLLLATGAPTLDGAEAEHALVINLHHIVTDAWSMGVLVRELAALYGAFLTGVPSPLPALPIQYADFAVWQRSRLWGKLLGTELVYWRERLAGAPPRLDLPTDRPRPAAQRFRGGRHFLRLPEALVQGLQRLAHREGASLFMALLAGFDALLARLSGQSDLSVGTPIANRTRAEVEELIGCFVNTLVLRVDTGSDPGFAELMGRAREVALGAYSHQSLPFEKLVEELQPERSLSYSPLFQVLLVLQNTPAVSMRLPGVLLESLGVETKTSRFDLLLALLESEGGLSGELNYDRDLFDRTTMARFATQLARLLEGAVADPLRRLSELPLL
ncbi:MAG TPA: condensation domain-containing protein, partial [Thermoanaerobaculia bacterium]|nr:condensation domain-containing protein [Thermoanaerobaculia bacterium]